MILIDDRVGSKDLMKYFSEEEAELVRLEFGDACWYGNGPDGQCWSIGVERKTVGDLVNSIRSGRLSGHQLIGLMQNYQVVYLIVEGLWRGNPKTGALQVYRGEKGKGGRWRDLSYGSKKFTAGSLVGYINTLDHLLGVSMRGTASPRETAVYMRWLCSWWQKDWEGHKAHKQYHKSRSPGRVTGIGHVSLEAPSLLQRIASELPGIGYEKSCRVARHFDSVTDCINAPEEEWVKIEGIGKGIVEKIQKAIG